MVEKLIQRNHDTHHCTPDHPLPQDASEAERHQWVHTDFLGFYDGVYNWEYECQNCGTRFEAGAM